MNHNAKRAGRTTKADKPAKRPAEKRAWRDIPDLPTAKQIEDSINKGTSVPLSEFVKGVKL